MKTIRLQNNITKVPFDTNFFTKKYRKNYDVKIPKNIDSTSIYIEIFHISHNKKFYRTDGFKSVYRFYSNGCVNLFSLENNQKVNDIDLNPNIEGNRGVSYLKKGHQIVSLVVPVTGYGRQGIKDYEINIKGDTLFVRKTGVHTEYHVFIKEKLSEKNLNYRVDW